LPKGIWKLLDDAAAVFEKKMSSGMNIAHEQTKVFWADLLYSAMISNRHAEVVVVSENGCADNVICGCESPC